VPSFSATLETDVMAPQARAFECIAPIDLFSIFVGYGPLPAVTGTTNQTGGWDAAGQTRVVLFSDGNSARETLTHYRHPTYFAYTVSSFTGPLRHLTTEAHGQWWFSDGVLPGSTHVRWSYSFVARSLFTAPFLWLVTQLLWRGYMRKALLLSKAQVEHNV
jgi:Polyketide cyclase / dehydrase and lipid transport